MNGLTPALQYFTVIKKKYLPLRWLLVLASKPYLQVYNKWKQFSEKTEGLNNLLFGHAPCLMLIMFGKIWNTSNIWSKSIKDHYCSPVCVLIWLASPNILAPFVYYYDADFGHTHPRWLLGVCVCVWWLVWYWFDQVMKHRESLVTKNVCSWLVAKDFMFDRSLRWENGKHFYMLIFFL